MTFFCGRLPVHLLLPLLTLAFTAQAQHNLPLTLAQAEQLALDQEPGQAAMLAQASALEDQAVAAGQLPDPTLRAGLANYPISSGGFSTEGMTQAQLGLRQSFPSGKSRAFSTQHYQSLALGMGESAHARSRDVLTQTRRAWLEAYYWQRARDIVTESRPFFGDLVEVTRSQYAVGRKTQHDLLRAELELSRLDDRLIEIDRRYAQATAMLSAWTGPVANRPISSALPALQQVPEIEVLRSALATHPSLLAAEAQIDARRAGVNLAEEQKKPGWALDLGYGYRDGTLPSGDPRSDFVSLSVSIELPFFQKNRQDRKLSAALSERGAAEYKKDQLLREMSSQLDAAFAHWTDLTRRVGLYESRILSLSEDQAQAALLAYQSEAGDFADVMRGYIDDLNTRLEHVRLQVDRGQSYAVLANLGGIPQ
jgi:outer membrane protein TolC